MKSIVWFVLVCVVSSVPAAEKHPSAEAPEFADGWRVTGVIRMGGKTEASVEHRAGGKRFAREGDTWSPGVVVERIDGKHLTVTLRRGEQTCVLHAGPGPDIARKAGDQPPPAGGAAVPAAMTAPALRAAKIVVPSLELVEAPLPDVVEFLLAKSREQDPEKKGVNIVLQLPPEAKPPAITLNLRDIPLLDALQYVARIAGMELATDERTIRLQPKAGGK